MSRPLAIDLCCKAGGASMGLAMAGYDVIGVDIERQPRYPFPFVQADVLRLPFDLRAFDFIWGSPPCQAHTEAISAPEYRARHTCIIAPMREMLEASGVLWCMENVRRAPIRPDLVLDGTMFPRLKVIRRRHFEMNFPAPFLLGSTTHDLVGAKGWASCTDGDNSSHVRASRRKHGLPHADSTAYRRECMGITWPMNRAEVGNAIPPAYSEFIGRHALAYIASRPPDARVGEGPNDERLERRKRLGHQ
jgi:DNA (cytosine-5)-methyltransferase 1